MINGLAALSRKINEHSTINPELGARCQTAGTNPTIPTGLRHPAQGWPEARGPTLG